MGMKLKQGPQELLIQTAQFQTEMCSLIRREVTGWGGRHHQLIAQCIPEDPLVKLIISTKTSPE